MPIYRVPELSSSLTFHNRNNNHQPPIDHHHTDHQHHHHQQQQQHRHHHHRTQHHSQHQTAFDADEVTVRRSHSMPLRMVETTPEPAEESIVEREIRLQLEKEAEIASLHRHLHNTNSHSASNHSSLPDGVPDKPKTHGDDHIHGGHSGHSQVTDDDRQAISQYSRVGESTIVKEIQEQKRREQELRRHHRNTETTKDKLENGPPSRGKSETPGARQVPKVQPFEDEDDDDDDEVDFRQDYINPQVETLIEREVRLLRQREGSLRRLRGYPVPQREERLKEVEIRPPRHHPHVTSDGQRGQMDEDGEGVNLRRLATNRLKQEMLRERQRELDLRRQGKIYTISEERVGLDPSLVVESGHHGSSRRHSEHGAERSSGDGYSNHFEATVVHSGSPGKERRSSNPATDQLDGRQGEAMPSWKTSAEMRIEAEVREARRRERELREQRRLLNAAVLTSPSSDFPPQEKQRSDHRRT